MWPRDGDLQRQASRLSAQRRFSHGAVDPSGEVWESVGQREKCFVVSLVGRKPEGREEVDCTQSKATWWWWW